METEESNVISIESWICRRCKHESTSKSNLLSHLRRKKPCKVTSENVKVQVLIDDLLKRPVQEKKRYSCSACNYQFNNRQSKSRHMKTCKVLHKDKKKILENADDEQYEDEDEDEDMDDVEDDESTKQSEDVLNIASTSKIVGEIRNMKKEIADIKNALREVIDTIQDRLRPLPIPQEDKQVVKKPRTKIPCSRRISTWNAHIGIDVGRTICMCCQKRQITQHKFTCGHIISDKDGGSIEVSNLRPICFTCNEDMHDENMRDFAKRIYNVEFD